ncbi:MAG: double-strand break repair protein AddB [Rhodobacterales bacterium RIFCSPHIGHO2_02_FULL_62_130]|nr:MAG: double-strand break repair protein AddB [Rhodobacterales bacterium RIFCSPHIGHO2_02_FULL_62_130]OHC55617.1 MAG: double-strand break repair protein AddB [Rhodobacterales bacterium RIFCSPHIGHO2_12_FULL_62_75]HCZ01112.1 double-strand break repair protein AddB [Rhodobacter sp.]
MFDTAGPRLFALPCGADFPAHLVLGLQERLAGQPPQAMARVQLYVNTARMRRRVTDLLTASGAALLPRIHLITDLAKDAALPPAVPPLRRRLELAKVVAGLLQAQPDLAPRAALYDLSDSLAKLMDEMQGEGVLPEAISRLDVSNHSAHWSRTQRFLEIIAPYFADTTAPDAEARQRLAVLRLAAKWQAKPPADPVIVAGSTGSRGTTALLMQLVAGLPQGALVLPGFDTDLPAPVWDALAEPMTSEDHPQYRFRHLLDLMQLSPTDVCPWRDAPPPDAARNRLVSLALRPAPVTDQWLLEGPSLPDLLPATQGVTLLEAPSARIEALSIALILRQSAENGTTAALISPDRNLTRQVTAALDRWNILPDDSAGRPLALSAPGRFLRHVAGLFGEKLTADQLLVLLKHPLTASGAERGTHLRFTRDLELKLRRYGPAFPTPQTLRDWAATRKDEGVGAWADWLGDCLTDLETLRRAALADHITRHRALAEALARGSAGQGSGGLWDKPAGIAALAVVEELTAESPNGGDFTCPEYRDLILALLNKVEVRDAVQPHPRIMIWGTLEARVQGAELVILGGLNDGIWPKLPEPDPWLNRQMRKDAGLLLPERQIGLSAHDFQQAIAAPRVVLTRALRNAEAETVPSRWLNRLVNLMEGLPTLHGKAALDQMRARGTEWLVMAQALERPTPAMQANPRLQPATRPQPRPPVSARPEKLSLTGIATLIRDPYAIYARYILRLHPLDPLRQTPDPRDRGMVFHEILERFVKTRPDAETLAQARGRLLQTAAEVLAEETPFPAARALWLARLDRAAGHFLAQDAKHGGTALAVETEGKVRLDPLPFTLFGTPDRIDRLPDGRLLLIDYKTGTPPTKPQQEAYEKQLLLAAAMAERGGFADLGPSEVARISYVGLGAASKVEETEIDETVTGKVWEGLIRLITRYLARETGYTARRAVFEDRYPGDYDHLARYGEWQMSDRATPETVGPEGAP